MYCLNCRHFFRTKNKLESHEVVYEKEDFYIDVLASQNIKILEFYQYHKPVKTQFIIYEHLESLIKKMGGCKNNPEKKSK